MKTLYLIRGLPGSGKSTLAQTLTPFYYEADMFFMVDGKYVYNKEYIATAHKWCQDNVRYAMQDGINSIAVSNTFVKRWEMEPYITLAQTYGYRITEITLTGDTYANLHDVPDEVMERMKNNWEK